MTKFAWAELFCKSLSRIWTQSNHEPNPRKHLDPSECLPSIKFPPSTRAVVERPADVAEAILTISVRPSIGPENFQPTNDRHRETRTDDHVARQDVSPTLGRPLMPHEKDRDLPAANKTTW